MKTAVLIPCLDEESTVGKVVDDFKKVFPDADIYVFDNSSKDDTFKIAEKHGAICRRESKKGKGYVVRRMFREVDADIYVLVDGDDTYDVSYAKRLVKEIENGADMCIGKRLNYAQNSFIKRLGNKFINLYVKRIFRLKGDLDVLSGYRSFSRDFVKKAELNSEGFDIDMEMTLYAIMKKKKVTSLPVECKERSDGSIRKRDAVVDWLVCLGCVSGMYWGRR